MKKILLSLTAILSSAVMTAQDVSQFKQLDDSLFASTPAYQNGNRYQRDAMLFVDMLADTHPYYIKKERRDILFARQDDLLKACAACGSDTAFVSLLRNTLGDLRDKHTDIIDMQQLKAVRQAAAEKAEAQADTLSDALMAYKGDLFHYVIVPEAKVCYLQFNRCMDARTMRDTSLPRWDKLLDEMFSKMKNDGITTLVVDAQYNNGGSSSLCDELLVRLRPYAELRNFSTALRFSRLMAAYNPRIAAAKTAWESQGHIDELYTIPSGKTPPQFVQPELFGGKVIFVQGAKTFSSAGMLMTLARDNNIGTIVGSTSTYTPSHYGEVLPFRLPNTGVVGSVSCKFFARPDTAHVDDKTLEPDTTLDLTDKEKAWQAILDMIKAD